MPYCPHCGNETEQVIPLSSPVAEAVNAEVEIARINAERDIKVAEISARGERDWNETRVEVAEIEAEAQAATALAEAEVIGAALEAGAGSGPEPDPIVITAPEAAADDEDLDDMGEIEGSPPPAPPRKKIGLGAW